MAGLSTDVEEVEAIDNQEYSNENIVPIEETDIEIQSTEINVGTETHEKLIKLPLSRIRGIIKTDTDVKIASHEAVVTLAKAAKVTKLFLKGRVMRIEDYRESKHLTFGATNYETGVVGSAIFLISELFIQSLAKEAAMRTVRDKRKIVLRKHLDSVFETKDCYSFLEGVLESFEEQA